MGHDSVLHLGMKNPNNPPSSRFPYAQKIGLSENCGPRPKAVVKHQVPIKNVDVIGSILQFQTHMKLSWSLSIIRGCP